MRKEGSGRNKQQLLRFEKKGETEEKENQEKRKGNRESLCFF